MDQIHAPTPSGATVYAKRTGIRRHPSGCAERVQTACGAFQKQAEWLRRAPPLPPALPALNRLFSKMVSKTASETCLKSKLPSDVLRTPFWMISGPEWVQNKAKMEPKCAQNALRRRCRRGVLIQMRSGLHFRSHLH